MAEKIWELFATLPDYDSAQVVAAKLAAEGIATTINAVTVDSVPNRQYQVFVESFFSRTARRITNQPGDLDGELEGLASGKPPDDDKQD